MSSSEYHSNWPASRDVFIGTIVSWMSWGSQLSSNCPQGLLVRKQVQHCKPVKNPMIQEDTVPRDGDGGTHYCCFAEQTFIVKLLLSIYIWTHRLLLAREVFFFSFCCQKQLMLREAWLAEVQRNFRTRNVGAAPTLSPPDGVNHWAAQFYFCDFPKLVLYSPSLYGSRTTLPDKGTDLQSCVRSWHIYLFSLW